MKATVNIGLRTVDIEYSIDKTLQNAVPFDERGDNWEMFQKTTKSKKIQCKQHFSFNDSDEWFSVQLLDGRIIDFHYDYNNRSEFESKKDWASYIFQGYVYTDGEPQLYEEPVVKRVVVVL
jgi:hypothetical protein